jgi:hypothetical protein
MCSRISSTRVSYMLQFINVAGSISDRESAGTSVLFISADVAEGTAR